MTAEQLIPKNDDSTKDDPVAGSIPDECMVMLVDDNTIDILFRRWGYVPRIIRLNWSLAQQLAADLQWVIEETKR